MENDHGMTSTKPSFCSKPQPKRAILLGVDEHTIRRVREGGYEHVSAYAFPGQGQFPGITTYLCGSESEMSAALTATFKDDGDVAAMVSADVIDCVGYEKERNQLTLLLERQLGIFGNDVLDALQAPLHIAQNASLLMDAPETGTFHYGKTPVLAIGAGPSLANHYEELRRLNGKVIVVAVDSALERLQDEGITVHFCTPVERVFQINRLFTRDQAETIFLGMPLVCPDVVRRFKRHAFNPNHDILFDWACAGNARYPNGMGTGTMSVYRAIGMTDGPVYLVGHDLAFTPNQSHAAGLNSICTEPRSGYHVPANVGGTIESCDIWDRFRRDIGQFIGSRPEVYNVAAADGMGAVIPNAKVGPLPQPGELPPTPPVILNQRTPGRYARFQERAKRVPRDARMLAKRAREAATGSDISMRSLVRSDNWQMFSYVWRSVYAHMYLEGQTGRKDLVRDWFAEASANIVETYEQAWKDIANA